MRMTLQWKIWIKNLPEQENLSAPAVGSRELPLAVLQNPAGEVIMFLVRMKLQDADGIWWVVLAYFVYNIIASITNKEKERKQRLITHFCFVGWLPNALSCSCFQQISEWEVQKACCKKVFVSKNVWILSVSIILKYFGNLASKDMWIGLGEPNFFSFLLNVHLVCKMHGQNIHLCLWDLHSVTITNNVHHHVDNNKNNLCTCLNTQYTPYHIWISLSVERIWKFSFVISPLMHFYLGIFFIKFWRYLKPQLVST